MEKHKRKIDIDDIESTNFSIESIASSINDIIVNSENQTFRERCAEILSIQNLEDSSIRIKELLNQIIENQRSSSSSNKKKKLIEE